MDYSAESDSISHEAKEFYDEVCGLVVVLLLFIVFFIISHVALHYFLTKYDSESKPSRADRLVYQLVLGICTFSLTIGFTLYSILPLSILTNEILHLFPHSYYIQWLHTDWIHHMALAANIGTKISCLLIPFAYFLSFAQGFLTYSNYSLTSRIIEALINLILVYILIFGFVWSMGNFIDGLHQSWSNDNLTMWDSTGWGFFQSHPISFVANSIKSLSSIEFLNQVCFHTIMCALEIVQVTICLIGLFFLFACAPMGLLGLGLTLIGKSLGSWSDSSIQSSSDPISNDRLDQLYFETLIWMDDIQSALMIQLPISNDYRSALTLNPQTVCFNNTLLDDNIGNHYHDNNHPYDTFLDHGTHRLNLLKLEWTMMTLNRRMRLNHQPIHDFHLEIKQWLKPRIYTACVGILFVFIKLMQMFVFFNICGLIWNILIGFDATSTTSNGNPTRFNGLVEWNVPEEWFHWLWWSNSYKKIDKSVLGLAPVSFFGHLGAILHLSLINFLLLISLWGFYSIPMVRYLRPHRHSTTLDSALLNVFLILMLCAALPLQTNLLGLTSLTVPNLVKTHYIFTSFSSNPIQPKCLNLSPSTSSSSTSSMTSTFWNWFSSQSRKLENSCKLDREIHDQSNSIWSDFLFWFLGYTNEPPISSIHSHHRTSLFQQFVTRAFGHSTMSISHGLGLIVLIYNLGFLFTSVWIAGHRLKQANLSFGLELMGDSMRSFHPTDWASMFWPNRTAHRDLTD